MHSKSLDLYILTGEASFFGPIRSSSSAIVGTLGVQACSPSANWLAKGIADHDHDFLLAGDGDRRLEVMALTLLRDFGNDRSPCLVLPSLMSAEHRAAAIEMLVRLSSLMEALGRPARLILHALTASAGANPIFSLRELQGHLRSRGADAELSATPVVSVEPGSTLEQVVSRNFLLNDMAERMVAQAVTSGLVPPSLDSHVDQRHASMPDGVRNDLARRIAGAIMKSDYARMTDERPVLNATDEECSEPIKKAG
ncbi:hypothetical protein [Rubellimicrobium arenae]|uniref:hypothetical protein n=1 Tax=Rubellimicrobium arenae TaxID=2817372 RepID=UPI001B3028B3|nr:hypothetical protein [Rubellimicrobium arenae]